MSGCHRGNCYPSMSDVREKFLWTTSWQMARRFVVLHPIFVARRPSYSCRAQCRVRRLVGWQGAGDWTDGQSAAGRDLRHQCAALGTLWCGPRHRTAVAGARSQQGPRQRDGQRRIRRADSQDRQIDRGCRAEIVAHAYAQEIIPAKFSEEEDRAHIAKTTSLLASALGKKPQGWISPRGTPGAHTARLLLEAGYRWQGDVFDDDRPYIQSFGKDSILAIPLAMEINDLPHAMRFGRSPRQFIELFDDNLAAAFADPDEAVIVDVTAHCHCYGRPPEPGRSNHRQDRARPRRRLADHAR